jgi:two-component system, NarL family, response regulator LiaR
MISVVIIEDLFDYREALIQLVKGTKDLHLLKAYANAEDAEQELPLTEPNVALVDINLPGINGIDLVTYIRKYSPKTLCMICTVYDDDEKVFHALQAGAHGYILKSTEPEKIIAAIFELVNGGSPMSSGIARKVVTAFKKQSTIIESLFTNREKEVLELLSKGLLYKEISAILSISTETVRRHCFNIYEKLHVHNRTEALNKYFGK